MVSTSQFPSDLHAENSDVVLRTKFGVCQQILAASPIYGSYETFRAVLQLTATHSDRQTDIARLTAAILNLFVKAPCKKTECIYNMALQITTDLLQKSYSVSN